MNKDERVNVKNKIIDAVRRYAPRVGIFVLAAVLMAFVLYHSIGADRAVVSTVAAVRSVEYEISGLTAYVFRDEQVVYSTNTGAATYTVSDGQRVATETEVARVYTAGSTEEYLARRYELEDRIALLERAVELGKKTAGGIDNTRTALSSSYSAFMAALAQGELDAADALSDDFFVALCAAQLIDGDGSAITAELDSLKTQLDSLPNSYGNVYQSIVSNESCYFFYGTDGYESVFDVDLLDSIDATGLRTLALTQPSYSSEGVPVGKYVHDHEWFMAMSAGSDVCGRLEEGKYYQITLSDGRVLDMYLERLAAPQSGDGIMVFSCSKMPEGFDYTRVQEVELLVNSIQGYRVPTVALCTQKGLDGVYVLASSEVMFRRVNIIYRGDDYVVVAERDASTENYKEFLNLNDRIITFVSDGELYEGRIFD